MEIFVLPIMVGFSAFAIRMFKPTRPAKISALFTCVAFSGIGLFAVSKFAWEIVAETPSEIFEPALWLACALVLLGTNLPFLGYGFAALIHRIRERYDIKIITERTL